MLVNCLKHFKTITHHKWEVLKNCMDAGILWQGITHDLSKYSPVEFFEYAKYYSRGETPITACKKDKGFCYAWLHHKGHNPHHEEFWVDTLNDEEFFVRMPWKYAVEYICDIMAASKVYNGGILDMDKLLAFWEKRQETMKMNESTKNFVTEVLTLYKKHGSIALDPKCTSQVYLAVCFGV